MFLFYGPRVCGVALYFFETGFSRITFLGKSFANLAMRRFRHSAADLICHRLNPRSSLKEIAQSLMVDYPQAIGDWLLFKLRRWRKGRQN